VNPSQSLLLASLILLLLTKLADLWTTIRHVGPHGESNPLARRLFGRFGFAGGLTVVMLVWSGIVVAVYVRAWWAPAWMQYLIVAVAFAIAWIQWDVARFNATRKPSRLTRIASRYYGSWESFLRSIRRRNLK